MKKIAHLTVNGRPLCACGGYDRLVQGQFITCGYCSIADAKRAKALLQPKLRVPVRVVPSRCPVDAEYDNA